MGGGVLPTVFPSKVGARSLSQRYETHAESLELSAELSAEEQWMASFRFN